MAQAAVKALFSGHVQGVGFRFTTQRVARGFDVTGTVRNLPDGRVELIAEGKRAAVEAFLDEVRGRLGGHIRNVTESWSEASGNYAEFRIAF